MRLSQLYGKRVCSANGKGGYIIKVYADGAEIIGFKCADDGEREFYIPVGQMKFSGEDIIFENFEKTSPKYGEVALGRGCFSYRGEYVGLLGDIVCRGFKLVTAKIGAKNYRVCNLVLGDIIIILPSARTLKHDVIKDGEIIFKSGEIADEKAITRAISIGEYVQTSLKSL